MRRPTVLFLNRVYPPVRGATGRVLRDLARSFAQEGWQVTVITTGPQAAKERDGSIRVIRLKGPERPRHALSYAWIWLRMTLAALRQPPTHLVVTMSDPPFLIHAGQMVKRWKKARHIHWCHDLYPDIFPALGVRLPGFMLRLFKRWSRKAMREADKVIVIGRCMAKTLTLDGMSPKGITVIPNWPDLELRPAGGYGPLTGPAKVRAMNGRRNGMNGHAVNGAHGHHAQDYINGAINGAAGFKPFDAQIKAGPKFRVLYAGNIGRAHPVDVILDAAEILQEEHPEIEFVFVGDGPRYDFLARERSRRRLDNVRLLPFQPASKLREVMESGDVHLISVKEEAAGLMVPSKLYAALAVERPCVFIGPAQSEAAKVITDFKAGVVVHQDQPEELARQIKNFRQNDSDWFAAHHGAASAGQIFLPEEAINAWIDRAWSVVEPDVSSEWGVAA